MTTLTISALSKHYHAGTAGCSASVSVLRNVHLALWQGEIVSLGGACGSGKSTLLRCAAGLLRPDAGSVRWFDGRVASRDVVAYLAKGSGESRGALHAQLERALELRCRIILIDDLELVGVLERRLVVVMLERAAASGASILLTASRDLETAGVATRAVTLAGGALVQLRKRSAARIVASSPASRARTSARSTYGRSLCSPQ